MIFEGGDRPPGQNGRVSPLVRWILVKLVGPAAATHKRKQGPVMKPGEANLGYCSRATADYEARVARQCHDEIAGISHSTRDQNAARPMSRANIVGGNDADDETTCGESGLRCNAGGRASAPAHERDAKPCDERTSRCRKIICTGTGLGAAQHTYLCATGSWQSSAGILRNEFIVH